MKLILPFSRTKFNALFKPKSTSQKKVFYDSPGMLDQSQHWGALVIWTIAVGTSSALIWAFIGKVDQTVNAIGTLEPISSKVLVESPSGGVVKNVYVSDGQAVSKGDQLAVIENLGLKARLTAVKRQIALLNYENTLLNLLIDGNGILPITLPSPPAIIIDEDRVRSVRLSVIESSSQLRQLRNRRKSQHETLKLKQEISESLQYLYETGGISRFKALSAADDVQIIKSYITQTDEQINILIAQAGRQTSSNTRNLINLESQLIDLSEESSNLTLIASISGRVFNSTVQSGSVISSGTELMKIIPSGKLKANVYLSNSDLGFVNEGQAVKLSVSSFPSSEYGYLNAKVTSIGADSLKESPRSSQPPNTYPLQVTLDPNLDKQSLLGRLKPGMQVSALIVVRQRPVIALLTDTFTKGAEDLQNSR